jgi:hypothetical protein
MEKISDRLQKLIHQEGISIRALEQKIGCSNGVLSKSISKGTDISAVWLSKIIEAYPKYNATWLLTGKGSETSIETETEVRCMVNNCDFMAMIDRKDQKLLEMSEEIGRLKGELQQYKKSKLSPTYNNVAEP